MSEGWQLKRTRQCEKCPWLRDVDPRTIPNGYCEAKHRALESTIGGGGIAGLASRTLRVMACHETHDAHCIGWLVNQIGPGNNIALRIQMMNCTNADRVRLAGEQHETFEDTLPSPPIF